MSPWIITALALCAAAPSPRVEISDPGGDDHGPGGYAYPSDALVYRRGSFDLRSFEVTVEGDDVVFAVTLAQPIRRPPTVRRTNASEIPLANNVYIQNIDIYIDRDPTPGAGFTEAIPGRNVTIAPENAWDSAVLITPQPALTRSMLDGWKPSRRVFFPDNVVAIGAKLIARISAADLGGFPAPEWGYQVLVTGATWEPTFDVIRRFVNDQGLNAFTMMVQTIPEAATFGGGEVELVHPMVIDLLAPAERAQEAILSAYDKTTRRLASVPLVYPNAEAWSRARMKTTPLALDLARPAVPAPTWIDLKVRDVQGPTIVLELGGATIEPYRMGNVLDASGQTVCRLVITSVHGAFAVATAVDCGAALQPGATTRFEKKVPKE